MNQNDDLSPHENEGPQKRRVPEPCTLVRSRLNSPQVRAYFVCEDSDLVLAETVWRLASSGATEPLLAPGAQKGGPETPLGGFDETGGGQRQQEAL